MVGEGTREEEERKPKWEPLIMPTEARVIIEWLVPTILLYSTDILDPRLFLLLPKRKNNQKIPTGYG